MSGIGDRKFPEYRYVVEKGTGTAAGNDTIKNFGPRRNLIKADELPEKR